MPAAAATRMEQDQDRGMTPTAYCCWWWRGSRGCSSRRTRIWRKHTTSIIESEQKGTRKNVISLDVAVDDGSDVVASGRLARCGMRGRLFLAEIHAGAAAAVNADAATVATTEELVCWRSWRRRGDSTGAGGALPPTHALSCSPTRRTAPNSEEGLRPTPKRGLRDAPGVHGGMRAPTRPSSSPAVEGCVR